MDAIRLSKRITLKRAQPNPLFQSWLEELHREAKKRKSKFDNTLNEALTSLSKYPLPLNSGAECAILKGFNKPLCTFLDKKLEEFKHSSKDTPKSATAGINLNGINSLNLPTTSTITFNSPLKYNNVDTSPYKVTNSQLTTLRMENNESKSKTVIDSKSISKTYKVTNHPVGYAILLVLLEQSNYNERKALDKVTIMEYAQKYCDAPWWNMERLIAKGLVTRCVGKKILYSLTDEGYFLAKDLLSSQDVPSVDNVLSNYDLLSQSQLDDHNNCKEHSLENNCISTNKTNSQRVCIEMVANSFDIVLLIDKCETNGVKKKNDPTVVEFKKYPHISYEYRSLKVGDYAWIARHKYSNAEIVLPYIVERKRIDDLAASIKDGRFHEQKFRLRRCGIDNVMYLIENYGSNKNVGLPMQSLLQALANTRVVDDFKIHVTKSFACSVRFLAILTKRLTLQYKNKNLRGWDALPEDNMLMTFNFFNKSSVKNKPLSVNETFIKILLQLKGVSVEKAVAITSQYKTPHSLISAYWLCDKKDGEMLLANLKYGDLGRKVGAIVSKTIYQLFCDMNV